MTRVALSKGDDRKKNIRNSLELIAADIHLKGRRPILKVNFVSTYRPLSATHPDAVRAIVEFLQDRGEKNIGIAEGATVGTTPRGFREYGYQGLAGEYGLELIDLNEPESWKVVFVVHPDMKPHPVKLAKTMRPDQSILVSLSGRGDKDIGTVADLAGVDFYDRPSMRGLTLKGATGAKA